VPLAGPEIAGVLNLRGRIVTAVDMRRRLGLPPRTDARARMAVGVELGAESYGLMIDSVGEVLKLGDASREPNPVNLDARLASVSSGVHRLDGQLMVILDVDRVLDMANSAMAA
jgi:purine-binding chemotaxis protein CheW